MLFFGKNFLKVFNVIQHFGKKTLGSIFVLLAVQFFNCSFLHLDHYFPHFDQKAMDCSISCL